MKQEFLVVYDYGQGGVWAYVLAESRQEIEELFPELRVVDERPAWLTEEEDGKIRRNRYLSLDVSDVSSGFLADILRARSRDQSK